MNKSPSMSIHHPKQRQIKLPFSVPKPGRTSSSAKRICGICRKNESEYTCPRCNIPYCSLACFKDQAHVQCSEPFYKSTVLDQIAADPKADMDEKKRMIEMLRRFEDAQAEGEDSLKALEADEDNEDEEGDELAKALEGVDLEEIDSNRLFHLLPQEHRDAFLAAIKDPESAEARALLDTDGIHAGDDYVPSVLPWWERDDFGPDSTHDGDDEADEDEDDLDSQVARPPTMIDQTSLGSITPPPGTGIKLIYNALALVLTYLHVLLSSRLPSFDDQYLSQQRITALDLKNDIDALVPFLSDQKSTVRYTTVREAWEAVWAKIGEATNPRPPPDTLLRLLSIVCPLLHPSIIASNPPKLLIALSDMHHLHSRIRPGGAVPRKLAFYLAALKGMGREDWLGVKREVERELGRLEQEVGGGEAQGTAGVDGNEGMGVGGDDRPALRI